MFAAFLGERQRAVTWRQKVAEHGQWLGLAPHFDGRALAGEACLALAWLLPQPATAPAIVETGSGLRWRTSLARPGQAESDAGPTDDNLIEVSVALPAGQTTVVIPPGTPEQFYYANDAGSWTLGNDLRLMRRLTRAELDERGLYALFQYGAIPAPLTLARRVSRVPNGHTLRVGPASSEPRLERSFAIPQPDAPAELAGKAAAGGDDAETRVVHTLDALLARLAPSTLYFSGGVDSSLLAARLQALGFPGIHLINFSFGPDDPEAQHALRVAGHLGLDCEQITYEPANVLPMLQRIGCDYSFPFVDRSVIPTNLLVRASLPAINGSRIIVEGTGADGAFGAWRPNSRVANLPQPVRALLAGGYGWLGLWRQPSEMERVARLARGSVQMPAAHALVIAQNVLDQIAYDVPEDARRDIEMALGEHVEALGAGLEIEQQFSLLDLVHICAGIFAAKSFDPLRSAGIRPVYPFLEPPMLRLSTSLAYSAKSAPGNPKAVLKRLLARHLPAELIERPKSGFVPPMQSILAQPAVQGFVRESVLAPDNPVLAYCRPAALRRLLARAAADQPLTKGAYRFVWAVIFASAWLKQSES